MKVEWTCQAALDTAEAQNPSPRQPLIPAEASRTSHAGSQGQLQVVAVLAAPPPARPLQMLKQAGETQCTKWVETHYSMALSSQRLVYCAFISHARARAASVPGCSHSSAVRGQGPAGAASTQGCSAKVSRRAGKWLLCFQRRPPQERARAEPQIRESRRCRWQVQRRRAVSSARVGTEWAGGGGPGV